MELFNPKSLNFDFVKTFKLTTILSVSLMIASIVAFFVPGLNYGIDFRGGLEARVSFTDQGITAEKVRGALESKLQNLSVVNFAESGKNEYLITALDAKDGSVSSTLHATLAENFGPEGQAWTVPQQSVVGPKAGSDLKKSALYALVYTILLVVIYMYWRFDVRFSPGAIACVIHDLILTVGFLALTRYEFSVTIVAALLTLAGYSINDTVVIFDRIRETEHKFLGKDTKFILNDAINSTLSRTVMTASTTLVSCAVLFFVGGGEIPAFAATLFFGIVVGTYSSAFVAAPLFLWASKKWSHLNLGAQENARSVKA